VLIDYFNYPEAVMRRCGFNSAEITASRSIPPKKLYYVQGGYYRNENLITPGLGCHYHVMYVPTGRAEGNNRCVSKNPSITVPDVILEVCTGTIPPYHNSVTGLALVGNVETLVVTIGIEGKSMLVRPPRATPHSKLDIIIIVEHPKDRFLADGTTLQLHPSYCTYISRRSIISVTPVSTDESAMLC
jgi:hypothetical protein